MDELQVKLAVGIWFATSHIVLNLFTFTPPWPFPSLDEKGEGLGVRLAPSPHKNVPAMETTAKELTSPGRRNEAEHANSFITAVDQSREDISSSIADLLTPKRRT